MPKERPELVNLIEKFPTQEISQGISITEQNLIIEETRNMFGRLMIHHRPSAEHSYVVAVLVTAAGIKLGYDYDTLKFLNRCGLWHDCGKHSISVDLLQVQDLSVEELEKIRKEHMSETRKIITESIHDGRLRDSMLRVIMSHHEILPGHNGILPYPRNNGLSVETDQRRPVDSVLLDHQSLLNLGDQASRILFGFNGDKKPNPALVWEELSPHIANYPNTERLIHALCDVI